MVFDKVTLINTNMNMSQHQKKIILTQKTKRNSAGDSCS